VQVHGDLPHDDAEFAQMFAAINAAELEQAKYMLNRTTSPMVRTYAQHMIDDHSTAQVKLQAATRGVALPAPPVGVADAAGSRGLDTLAQLSGRQRDNAYMRMQVVAHRRAMPIVAWEAQNGKVPTLKALASDTMPTLDNHARMALAYQTTGGSSMAVDAVAPAGTSPNGTLPNNPVTTSNGQTTGSENAAGAATQRQNTITNPNRTPSLSQPTRVPAPQPSTVPAPSPT
jgi:putative membrane protein